MASISKTVRPKRSNNSTVSPTGLGLAVGRGTPSASASGGAFDYYIGPSGSDSNPGTFGSPWAITALQTKTATITGKTVGLLDGTYIVVPSDSGGNNSGGIQVSATNLTVASVNARQAVITTNNGGSYPNWADPAFQSIGSGIIWDAITFTQSSWDFIRVSGNNTIIRNCTFSDLDSARGWGSGDADNCGAIFVATGSYPTLTIQNCKFDGIYNGARTHNGACIGPLYYAGNTTIQDCSFFNATTPIFWKASNIGPLVVRRCYFDSTVTGECIGGVMDNDFTIPMLFTCTNNVFNRAGHCLDAEGLNNPQSPVQSVVTFNTFITDTGYNILYANSPNGPPLSGANLHLSTLQDNVFQRVSGSDPILFFSTSSNIASEIFGQIDYNLYSAIQVRDGDGVTYSTLANWRTRLAVSGVTGREANSLTGTPTFVNASGSTAADFALASGAGKNAASDGTDMGAWGGGSVTSIGSTF